jgi:hypothetical protein
MFCVTMWCRNLLLFEEVSVPSFEDGNEGGGDWRIK